jgi:5-methylcytosine-specific restriction protein B
MHAHGTKDSLVYWLEFKDDEEFPARFGGIGGGSAYKFGIFRRKETGTWVSASGKDLTVEEAIPIARKHRDQLLRGVELLKPLPPNGSDVDYKGLQERLDREAPDVSDLMWGHKYFYLLCPDKLDPFHDPRWQRFHILKMLQLPPDGKGRYLCAGRFVAVASELDVQMNNLMHVLGAANGGLHGYWRIRSGRGDSGKNWTAMREGNCIALGWPGLGDLSHLEGGKHSREQLKKLLAERYPNRAIDAKTRSQFFNFVLGIAKNDIVLAADGGTIVGIGRVAGPYGYEATSDFPHRRPVEWLSFDEWSMPSPEGLQTDVHEVREHVANILQVERRIQGAPPIVRPPVHPPQPGPQITRRPGQPAPRLAGIPGRIQSVLERKGQLILYGPPGTGKTFWARRAALDLAAYGAFGAAFDQLGTQDKATVEGADQAGGLVRLCCFHPAYGYEDFIEGYRPETPNGQVAFRLRDGVFKRMAKEAVSAPDRRFFLIVDEINRGDIPRIFGELLTILEKDKRGKAIVLPVSGESFSVPSNVFVIGTMNTADRSISLLDAALRRRFGFIELMPDLELLRDQMIGSIPLGQWLAALNRRICAHVGRDARNLQIGHSYLMQGEHPLKDLTTFKLALRDDIIPLLEEYCYDDFTALQNILGNGLLDAENRRIKHELFDEDRDAELMNALLAPCPEITASAEALASEKLDEDSADEGETDDEGADQ